MGYVYQLCHPPKMYINFHSGYTIQKRTRSYELRLLAYRLTKAQPLPGWWTALDEGQRTAFPIGAHQQPADDGHVVNTGALALQARSTERLAPLQIHHFVSYKWTLHFIVLRESWPTEEIPTTCASFGETATMRSRSKLKVRACTLQNKSMHTWNKFGSIRIY